MIQEDFLTSPVIRVHSQCSQLIGSFLDIILHIAHKSQNFFWSCDVLVFLNGLLLGFSLIISLGPQNIFLIRQGALRQHAALSAIVCMICDVILIIGSVLGLHEALERSPGLRYWLYWIGIIFLTVYGVRSLQSALCKKKEVIFKLDVQPANYKIILIALGFSLLNPHAIIDSLIIIGANSTQFAAHLKLFNAGVLSASLIWFATITSIAYHFSSVLSKPIIWRQLELTSGILMLVIAGKLIINL